MRLGVGGEHALIGAVGARGNGLKEEVAAREVKDRLIEMFIEDGHDTTDISVDNCNDQRTHLQLICDKANAQTLDLSIHLHLNSFSKLSANGVETFSYGTTGKGYAYSKKVQHELVKSVKWYNRGCKTANFYVLKNTKAPAILVELGFISNASDMQKFNIETIARAIVKAITGKAYNSKPQSSTMWTLQTGAYSIKSNAKKEVARIKKLGVNCFAKWIDGLWKVQLGAYSVKDNAAKEQERLKAFGIDCIIV